MSDVGNISILFTTEVDGLYRVRIAWGFKFEFLSVYVECIEGSRIVLLLESAGAANALLDPQ